MKTFLAGVLATLALGGVAVAVAINSGLPDVAADTPHGQLVFNVLEFARERSIEQRSADIRPPANLGDVARVRRGAGNYDAMCAGCHLSPGVRQSEIRAGLYPTPPDLANVLPPVELSGQAAARQFWIIKHGIKATGMAAWGKGGMGDEDIWDLVAFLRRLPTLSATEYQAGVAASGGHAHAGLPEAHDAELHAHEHHSH